MSITARRICPAAIGLALLIFARTAAAEDIELPETAPLPQARETALKRVNENAKPSKAAGALSAVERQCRQALRELGAGFAEAPAVEAQGGCHLPHPIEVTALSRNMRLEPAAVLNCTTALAAARFFQTSGMSAARKHLGARITVVQQASAYVCRQRNGNDTISEHAFGNALDVSGVTLSDGRQIAVREAAGSTAEAKFLNYLHEAACGPFLTVLGPGSDPDHADHFHFDMKKRRNPFCQ